MSFIFNVLTIGASFWAALALTEFAAFGSTLVTNTPPDNISSGGESKHELSLVDAQWTAFQRNWDLLAARSGVDLATAGLLVAKQFPNPTFSFSSARIDPNGNGTFLGNNLWNRSYDSIFAVSQLVEIAGKRRNRKASGRAGVAGAQARFYDAKRALDQGVTKAYVAALLAEEKARVLNESARALRRQAEISETRFKAGDISDSDRNQIQNSAEVFELDAKSAEATAVQARIAVDLLMGVANPKGTWAPKDSLDKLTAAAGEGVVNPDARPDVVAAAADLSKAQADLALQKAMRIPDPTFSLFYEHNPPNTPGPDTFGLGVSFPLPLWNLNRGNIRAAQATTEQSALTLGKLEAQARADIADAEIAYAEARRRSGLYENEIRPRAARVRDTISFAYQKGGASLVDLLTAERDDNSIRLAAAEALADAANAAADLNSARNVVPATQLTSKQ